MPLSQIIEETGISADYWNVWNKLADTCLEYFEAENDVDRKVALGSARDMIPRNLDPKKRYHFQTYSSYCRWLDSIAPNTERVAQLDTDSQSLIDYLKEHQNDAIYDFLHIQDVLKPISASIFGYVARKLLSK